MQANKVIYKKYGNRRLYNTSTKAYVNLDDVTSMVKVGYEVQVIDARSGDDVTAYILTQIVLEEAKKKNYLLPPPFLHLIIRYGQDLIDGFFEKYLDVVLKNYMALREATEANFRQWLEMGLQMSKITAFRSFMDLITIPEQGKSENP
ncbi:MAG: hypothetical protein N2317_00835 [Syntrophales bacterium]|nr:hypothetical protein [Syntrophales bacterium]